LTDFSSGELFFFSGFPTEPTKSFVPRRKMTPLLLQHIAWSPVGDSSYLIAILLESWTLKQPGTRPIVVSCEEYHFRSTSKVPLGPCGIWNVFQGRMALDLQATWFKFWLPRIPY